jgi:hypothetical protein
MAPQFDSELRELLRKAGCTFVRQGKGSHEIWLSPITRRNFPVPVGMRLVIPRMQSCVRQDCQRHFDLDGADVRHTLKICA